MNKIRIVNWLIVSLLVVQSCCDCWISLYSALLLHPVHRVTRPFLHLPVKSFCDFEGSRHLFKKLCRRDLVTFSAACLLKGPVVFEVSLRPEVLPEMMMPVITVMILRPGQSLGMCCIQLHSIVWELLGSIVLLYDGSHISLSISLLLTSVCY